jgi:hypothetical protein
MEIQSVSYVVEIQFLNLTWRMSRLKQVSRKENKNVVYQKQIQSMKLWNKHHLYARVPSNVHKIYAL